MSNLSNQLKQMASESGCKNIIQPIIRKKKVALGRKHIQVETILMTSQVVSPNLVPLRKWMGLKELTGVGHESESLSYQTFDFQFDSYHYTVRPVRLVADMKPTFKVLIYDEEFVMQNDLEIYLKELTIDIPCCFLISLQENDAELSTNRLKLFSNCLHVEAFHSTDLLENGLLEKISDKKFTPKINLIELYNQINDFSIVGNILEQNLQTQKQLISNNNLLNKKELIKYRHRETEVSAKDINSLRNDLGKSFKNIARIIDEQAGQLDLENDDSYITQLKDKVDRTDKFYEEPGVKNILYKVPDGVIKDLQEGIYKKLKADFDKAITAIKKQMGSIEGEVRNSFRDLGVNSPILVSKTLPANLSDEILNQTLRFNRAYEKQIAKKGASHLMMEIRTPLFMIMPLMMFVGIFASFFQSDDKGIIASDVSYKNRKAIIIEKLPEEYQKEKMSFKQYAKTYVFRGSSLGFEKGIKLNQNLMAGGEKPMLAFTSKLRESSSSFKKNKKTRVYKPDFEILPNKEGLVLYCQVNPDEVKAVFEDCSKGLLCIQGKGSNFSIYKIGGLFAQLGPYRYLAIGLLFGLITWFVRSKKQEFSEEKIEMREREKKNLKQAMKQDVEKMVRTAVNRWRSKMQEYVKEQEGNLQFAIDNSLNRVIDANKEQVQEQMGIIERRMKNFQDEDSRIGQTQKELNAHLKKLQNMKFKFRELMNVV